MTSLFHYAYHLGSLIIWKLRVYSERGHPVEPLPPQLLPTVPHVTFSIFNMAIPNIIAWAAVIGVFFLAAWARLPKIF